MNTAKHRIDDLYLLSDLTADLFYSRASQIIEEHAFRCGSIVINKPPQHREPENAAEPGYAESDIIFRPEKTKGSSAEEKNRKIGSEDKPEQNLYRWTSRLPRSNGNGDIIVMAENTDQAREFARIQGRKYIHEHRSSIETLSLQEQIQALEADICNEPELIPAGVVLIHGSD